MRTVRFESGVSWTERDCPNGSAVYFNPGKGRPLVFWGWMVLGREGYRVYVPLGPQRRPAAIGSARSDEEARALLRAWHRRHNPV